MHSCQEESMKTGGRIALGVGMGYLLGRTRKMRLALMIAAAGATRKVGSPGQLVQRGLKQLVATPELGKLTEIARGELMNAAKAAAVTAASSRIDSLNERLQDRAGGRGKTQEQEEPSQDEDRDEETPARGRSRRQSSNGRAGSDEDTGEAGEAGEEEQEEAPDEGERERPAPRRRASTRTATRRRSADESEGTTARRGNRSRTSGTRTSTGRTPVRRTGR